MFLLYLFFDDILPQQHEVPGDQPQEDNLSEVHKIGELLLQDQGQETVTDLHRSFTPIVADCERPLMLRFSDTCLSELLIESDIFLSNKINFYTILTYYAK